MEDSPDGSRTEPGSQLLVEWEVASTRWPCVLTPNLKSESESVPCVGWEYVGSQYLRVVAGPWSPHFLLCVGVRVAECKIVQGQHQPLQALQGPGAQRNPGWAPQQLCITRTTDLEGPRGHVWTLQPL